MRPLSTPAIVLAVALAVLFFKVYGLVTRPDVPRPVSATLEALAPGVEIGARVREIAPHVKQLSYVRNLGFVAGLPEHQVPRVDVAVSFSQVRLFLDDKARRRPRPDSSARVAAVELLTADPGALQGLSAALTATFAAVPASGCIQSSDETLREVHYWNTRNHRGGVALVSNMGADNSSRTATPVVSVIAFTGEFDGGRTLRARFTPKSCDDVDATPGGDATTDASDSLTIAFAESVGDTRPSVALAASGSNEPLVGGDTLQACIDGVVSNGWTTVDGDGVELDLPSDFHPTARGRGRQEWTGADYSRVAIVSGGSKHSGWTGGISSECDVFVSGARTHIDVANASVYARDFVVHGYFEVPGKPTLALEAHARSRARQAALLHALRTVRILPTWGVAQ